MLGAIRGLWIGAATCWGVAHRAGHPIRQRRFADRLYEKLLIPRRDRQTAQIDGMYSHLDVRELRKVLPVGAGVYGVVIPRAFAAADAPLQRMSRHGELQSNATVDAGFDLCSFLVVVPRHKLQEGKLPACALECVPLRDRLQPRLPALLIHDAP